jgi:hypothetical protein
VSEGGESERWWPWLLAAAARAVDGAGDSGETGQGGGGGVALALGLSPGARESRIWLLWRVWLWALALRMLAADGELSWALACRVRCQRRFVRFGSGVLSFINKHDQKTFLGLYSIVKRWSNLEKKNF